MAYGQSTIVCEESFECGGGTRRGSLSILPWSGALALGAALALLAPPAATLPAAMRPANMAAIVAAHPVVAVAAVRPKAIGNPYGDLAAFGAGPVDPRANLPYGDLAAILDDSAQTSSRAAASLLASLDVAPPAPSAIALPREAPTPPKRDEAAIDQTAPLPPLRPTEFASLAPPAPTVRRPPPPNTAIARAIAPPDDRNVFQKLFEPRRPPNGAVAYAAPDDQAASDAKSPALAAMDRASGASSFARSAPPPTGDNLTAVYDISARTVTLPDGTKLEAHSGLGPMLDDPRYVAEHDRGATPPHVYELESRDGLFHGVQALRLDPVGGDATVFGRSGLLAHSYMLGPGGDSNGCVSFKDYDAFLRAYQQGRVKRLVVVARAE